MEGGSKQGTKGGKEENARQSRSQENKALDTEKGNPKKTGFQKHRKTITRIPAQGRS